MFAHGVIFNSCVFDGWLVCRLVVACSRVSISSAMCTRVPVSWPICGLQRELLLFRGPDSKPWTSIARAALAGEGEGAGGCGARQSRSAKTILMLDM